MYFYIYDSFLREKKYERDLAIIETRLTDLGISGKIGRLTPFTNARGLIRDEARRGVQTVVVVGNDETVAKVIDGIGEEKITLGILPVGSPTYIANSLGIPEGPDACDELSKRITQKIDLGRINGRFFLSDVRIPRGRVIIEGEGKYRISTLVQDCEVIVSNLRSQAMATMIFTDTSQPGDPKDGWLDALITPRPSFGDMFRKKGSAVCSVFPLRKMNISSEEPIAVVADGREFSGNNLCIEVVPDRLKIITGRERAFA